LKIPGNKIHVIHNGIDPSPFETTTRGRVRPTLNIGSSEVVLVCVANFRLAKGHEVLLDSVNLLIQDGVSFFLWLVGDGDLRPAMEAKTRSLGLSQTIKFLGQRSDIPDILADADLFVLASHWEGMPGAVMEAMAAKLPVVATDVGGIPELVVDGETGLLVPPGKPELLASALKKLIRDKKLRRKMGIAGHRRIVTHFRLKDKVREQEEVYFHLLGRS
ncbi:MAG TPA: glycosyltransferase, partial [bacterium (Candidatus Stahlbacteria)]|nr:glycosyltransferase [Candidatus Stahlbacteria bacterium]